MAARYWVGGTNNWNNATSNWSTTDGGAPGATVPGAADTVFFTALSGTVTVTWSSGASGTVLSINSTGFTGTHVTTTVTKTLAGTGTVWSSPATCTITGTPTFTVNSTGSTAISVVCNHKTPSATNAPNFSFTGGTYALTCSGNGWRNIIFTGFAGSIASGTNPTSYGDITLSTGGTFTAHDPTMAATGTFTSNGKTIAGITVNAPGGTVTLNDPMVASNIVTLTAGTLNAANFNVTAGSFSSSNSNTRTLNMGSATWAITGSGTTAWNTATTTGLTVNPSTSTITMTSASAKTFAGGGRTYYNLNQGGAGTLTISGSNTFNDITDSSQPSTVTFTAGTTQTVPNFSLAGTAGNLVTINSTTPGSQFTLSKASGTVNAQYLAIQDSNATGGAKWNALFSTNLGNNTGWIFPGGNMFMMF